MTALLRFDRRIIPDQYETRLFSKVRNEIIRLPYFLSYYRNLGVDRFLFIDNGSTDGTVRFLSEQPDCHIFITSETLAGSRAGMDWIQHLLDQYGCDRWCVVVDADELFVYRNAEVIRLSAFCQSIEASGANAFFCVTVDMYSDADVDDVAYTAGQPFLEVCPFFDQTGYTWLKRKARRGSVGPLVVGGPRTRVFYPELLDSRFRARARRSVRAYLGKVFPGVKSAMPIYLNKIPLVRWNKGMSFEHAAHYIMFAKLARGHGALLHFKFLGNFVDHVKEEDSRKAYLGRDAYRRYLSRIGEGSTINFMCDLSKRYVGTHQLADLGLVK